jgi:sugar phosphate isomerase/epimerase
MRSGAMNAIGNSMYSFHRMFQAGELDACGFPPLCAELGILLLEVNPTYLPDDEEGFEQFERAVQDARCRVIQMTCDFPLCADDEAGRTATVGEVRKWAQVANRLSASTIRCNLGRLLDQDVEKGTAQVIESFKEIVPLCEELGLAAVIENTHGPHTGSADRILRILEGVGSDALGTCPDLGNFPEDARYDSLAKLMPHAKYLHAKVWQFDAAGNEATYDFPRCVEIAKSAGYLGAWGIEFEAKLDESVPDERAGVRLTRELLLRSL